MGDAADQALERAEQEMEHFERYKDAPMAVQYEEGLIDENGNTIGNPFFPSSPPGWPF